MIWYVYFSLRGFLAFDIYDGKLWWDFSSLVADILAVGIHSVAEKYFLKLNIHKRNTRENKIYLAWCIFHDQNDACLFDMPFLDKSV